MHETGHFEQFASPEAIWNEFSRFEGREISTEITKHMENYLTELDIKQSGITKEKCKIELSDSTDELKNGYRMLV